MDIQTAEIWTECAVKQLLTHWTEGPMRRRVMTSEERMMLGYVDCISSPLRRRAACRGMTQHDFAYHSAFLHHVIVKVGHGIWAAVHFWRSAVLRFQRYAVTAEAADAVYVELLHAVTLLLPLPF